jgi:hypothetical protein
MKTQVTQVKVVFEGIYEWGRGFLGHEQYVNWYLFWSKVNKIYWNCFMKQENGQMSYYLVTTYGGGYIHPQDFTLTLTRVSNGLINELKELCEECARDCGGTAKLYVATKDVDFGEGEILKAPTKVYL